MTERRINLVVDGRPFEGSLAGVGYYIIEVLKQLIVECPELQVTIVSRRALKVEFPFSVRLIIEPNKLLQKLKPLLWLRYFSSRLIDECDIYWGTAVFLPARLNKSVKTLVTVHDFNHLVVPETMVWGNRLAHQLWMRKELQRANLIMANGEGTAQRLFNYSGRNCDLIINPPVRSSLVRMDEATAIRILSDLKIAGPFFLAVGTHEPRKNLKLLINAFLGLKKEGKLKEFGLVLAGQSGWKNEDLTLMIKHSCVHGVISLGYVDDAVLSALYSTCHAFVFPSIYEGFGMPVREAMTCGAAIIATDIPEIREAALYQGNFINPAIDYLKDAMLEASFRAKESFGESDNISILKKRSIADMVKLTCHGEDSLN